MCYLNFNKPYGVLSKFTDEGTGHPRLKQNINVPEVYVAARLDRLTTWIELKLREGKKR
jgi:23S rRNA pseudouridine2457 synthase